MCGIGGIISFNKLGHRTDVVKELCKKLIVALQSRGMHASGIATISFEPYTYNIMKDAIPAETLVRRKTFDEMFKEDTQIVMLHTRATTRGSERFNVNNHPHLSKQTNSLLIHNGMISNYDELKTEYNLETDGDCDSEIILRMIEKFGFNKAIKKLKGSMTIGVMDGIKQEFILYRNDSNPLVLAYLPNFDMYIFASTSSILESVLSKKENIKTNNMNFIKTTPKIDYGVNVVNEDTKTTFDMINTKIRLTKIEPKYDLDYNQQHVFRWSSPENSKEDDEYV